MHGGSRDKTDCVLFSWFHYILRESITSCWAPMTNMFRVILTKPHIFSWHVLNSSQSKIEYPNHIWHFLIILQKLNTLYVRFYGHVHLLLVLFPNYSLKTPFWMLGINSFQN